MFTRIYPAGGRVGSSNYNPDYSWEKGCQIVCFLTILLNFLFILIIN